MGSGRCHDLPDALAAVVVEAGGPVTDGGHGSAPPSAPLSLPPIPPPPPMPSPAAATLIDAYLAALPPPSQDALNRLRRLVASAVPEPEEAIKTGVPAIRYRGKTVVGFGAAREHLSLYVMFGDALRVLADDLARYDTSNTVVRFSPERPLPAPLVERIVAIRVGEIEAQTSPPKVPVPPRETR